MMLQFTRAIRYGVFSAPDSETRHHSVGMGVCTKRNATLRKQIEVKLFLSVATEVENGVSYGRIIA